MTPPALPASLPARLEAAVRERLEAGGRFFDAEAERLARLCHLMAERLVAGGRLLACAEAPGPSSDARHVAVEFVHPVIVGKRALPAIAVLGQGSELCERVRRLAHPQDVLMGFDVLARSPAGAAGRVGAGDAVAAALAEARAGGCLTVGFSGDGAEWEFPPPTEDPSVAQELVETLYHVLWELVHVFFEHRGLLTTGERRQGHDPGASSFLYPFLVDAEDDLERVLKDVAGSVRMKAEETGELRAQTITLNAAVLLMAGAEVQARLEEGATLLALGNGGSATDAMDVVADFRSGIGDAPGWPALDLAEDPGIITAIANDIGPEAIFARQVIALGRRGDVLLVLSTSGNSGNVIDALAEARGRGLLTVALVGYDGGRVASEGLADHVVVTPSEHIPRIQEAQASAYHVLRELVG